MFERFTTNARGVVIQAQVEARQLQHGQIGTEHILLGLFGTPTSIAAQALSQLGVTATAVRDAVEVEVGRGKEAPTGHIPFSKRAKKILELSLREALQLKHNYIGTEHILLAIQREGEGLAAKILANQVHDLLAVRSAVLELLGAGQQEHGTGDVPRRTNAADEVVQAAQALAGGAPMGSHHLLEALIRAEGSMAAKVLTDLGVDPAAVAAKVDEFDTEDTTDATPEETAARKMELRFVTRAAGDETGGDTGAAGGGTGGSGGAAGGGQTGAGAAGAGHAGAGAAGTGHAGGGGAGAGAAGAGGTGTGGTGGEAGVRTGEEAGGAQGEAEASAGGGTGGAGEETIEEVHLVFRDQATINLAKAVAGLVEGPITGTGPVAGKFVPLWTATNDLLMSLLQSLREGAPQEERSKAALLVRRVLHDRLRRRGRAAE
jgi:ATP-dependent Clp protease ATP-binding subunit ClpC